MKRVKRLAALLLLLALTACPGLKALNDEMERNMMAHPGGQLGAGLDAALAGMAVQNATPRRR